MDKKNNHNHKDLEFFISNPLASADRLRKKLYKSHDFYKNNIYTFVPTKEAKKLFYYGVSLEISKAISEIILLKDIITDNPTENDSLTGNIVYNSTIDKQNSILRKLSELLSLLINFDKKTKSSIEYRIYQSAIHLDTFLNRQKAFKDSYGVENNNIQSSINTYNSRIKTDLKKLNNKIPWFLNETNYRKLIPSAFTSWMSIYKEAIKLSNDEERTFLGINHERYSIFSQNVHAIITNYQYKDARNEWNKLKANAMHISLLAMHIMDKCYEILKCKDPNGLRKIFGPNLENSDASLLMSKFKKKFNIGDIVFIHSNDLAEIIESTTGKLGFTAYKIKYLSLLPLSEYTEDWIEGRRLTFLFAEKGIRKFFEESIKKGLPKNVDQAIKSMLKEKDEIVIKLMKDSLIQLHRDGLLTKMLLNNNIISLMK